METKELIQALRLDAEWAHANEWETPITLGDHLDAAADALEALLAEVERQAAEIAAVTAERDACKVDLCTACTQSPCNTGICAAKNCTGNQIPCNFEWRGAGKEQNDG